MEKNQKRLPLAWGTGSSFGQIASEENALNIIKCCLNNEIRIFDTGASYACGNSEKLLGYCLEKLNVNRYSLLLSTKIGSIAPTRPWEKTKKDYSASTTINMVHSSLRNLHTDYIDLIFFHSLPSTHKETQEAVNALIQMKKAGDIRMIGVAAHSLKELNYIESNCEDFDAVMTHFNPLTFDDIKDVLANIKQKGLLIYGSAPYASGLLMKKRNLIDLGKPQNSLFKLLRHAQRWKRLTAEKKRIAKTVIKDVESGNLDLLDYSLFSELVDITITGSLSTERIATHAKQATLAKRLSEQT